MAESTPAMAMVSALAATSSLLMAIEEVESEFLLQSSKTDLRDLELWYLDTVATNHMTKRRNYFTDLDDSTSSFVKIW